MNRISTDAKKWQSFVIRRLIRHSRPCHVTQVPHRSTHEKRIYIYTIFLASVDIRRKCVSCPLDPLTGRSPLGNLHCLCEELVCGCYFSPLSTSFVFHANVIRLSYAPVCGTRVTASFTRITHSVRTFHSMFRRYVTFTSVDFACTEFLFQFSLRLCHSFFVNI